MPEAIFFIYLGYYFCISQFPRSLLCCWHSLALCNVALFNLKKKSFCFVLVQQWASSTFSEASTFSITSIDSIWLISSLTFSRTDDIATGLGVIWLKGLCNADNIIAYSPSVQPGPLKTFRKCCLISSSECTKVPTLAMVSSAKQADLPSSGTFKPLTS